jgi:BirA family transcriptional regulator, biotin operon repressor / biotin---[acetyl-CoA-carboxylase] ligase
MYIMIIGSKIYYYQQLTSTNTEAVRLMTNNDVAEGSVICSGYQSSGRGQAGNTWESEENKNLLISIILYPTMIEPSGQFLISMTISLGLCDYLKRHVPDCSIKWPNDIYVNNDKIAGILIENSIMGNHIQSTVAGIGLNVNQVKFLSAIPNPVSLSILTGLEYDLFNCLNQLVTDLDKRYKQLISEDYETIKSDYISKLYRINEWSGFRDIQGDYSGKILSVTDSGRLIVERHPGEKREYSFKEVEFIP